MKEIERANYRINGTIGIFLLVAIVELLPSAGRAKVLCHIADPQDPTLNVRSSPDGKIGARLENERVVRADETKTDAKGRIWAEISGSYRGDWRNWGWVLQDSLRCVDTDKFPREHLSVAALKSVGIVPQNALKTKTMPVCRGTPLNGWGLTISNELYNAYRKRGFSEAALCLVFGSSDVNFDPATGKRLPLYEIQGDIFGLRPLWLPDCYRQLQVVGKGGYLVGWRPTGCDVKYHPSTGLPIKSPELVELAAGGEAGGGVDEDNRSSSVSEDRLRVLVGGR